MRAANICSMLSNFWSLLKPIRCRGSSIPAACWVRCRTCEPCVQARHIQICPDRIHGFGSSNDHEHDQSSSFEAASSPPSLSYCYQAYTIPPHKISPQTARPLSSFEDLNINGVGEVGQLPPNQLIFHSMFPPANPSRVLPSPFGPHHRPPSPTTIVYLASSE